MKSLKSWLNKAFPEDRHPRAERRSVPGLEALHWTGSHPGLNSIRDISSTGMYVLTEERWPTGSENPIILTSSDVPKDSPDHEVMVQTKAVRWGEDGIGLSFVLPSCMELWLWLKDEPREPAEILREFRIARALGFLRRICPSAEQELKLLFREGLSNIRIENAVKIALRAEEMIAIEPSADKMQSPHNIVMRVVEDGSWAEDEISQQFWAGILATSCAVLGSDESNLIYIEILSQLGMIPSRIFSTACSTSTKVVSDTGSVTALPVILTSDQLIEIADAHDLMKIDRNLMQLSDLGLVDERIKSKYFSFTEDANVTPTTFGLEMYARCHGHRGDVHKFYF